MSIPHDFIPNSDDAMAKCLADPMWRLCSGQLYWIMVKSDTGEGTRIRFKPNRAQRRLLASLWHRNIILKARQLGFCLDPSTRVLTADLRWVRIDSLKAEDEVVSVDEHPPGGRGSARKMRTATVQATAIVKRMAHRITFDDGRTVVCTDQHPWLSRNGVMQPKWRSISGTGNVVEGRLKPGVEVRWITKPWDDAAAEDGWFGGMLDGEGSTAKRNVAASINVSQRHGPVWDRLVRYVRECGYNFCVEDDVAERPSKFGRVPVPKLVICRMDEMFRLVGQTRPTRFIGNRFWEGRELPGKRNGGVGWSTIVSIEPLGTQDMVDLQTSTGTYIAEGFVSHNTTLICILWLDHALFNSDQRCGVIAQDREAAEAIFRDKVKFAYDNLPDHLRGTMPLARDSATELLFGHNNSSVRVATSMRSGTIHRLLVSEYGKICAKYPDKANEVVTGSLPAVPLDGIAVIESTAEGQAGEFYNMTKKAQALHQQAKDLTPRDYRFHFFAWWANPEYEMDPLLVVMTAKDHTYFDKIEGEMMVTLSLRKRAWYVATRDADFSGDPEKMWQEYPSTPDEAFQISTEGKYYAIQLAKARRDGRIGKVPLVQHVPVNTFWDIGAHDGTAVWLHQKVGQEHRFIGFIENWDEPYSTTIKALQDLGYVWGTHYLPHDATAKRQQGHRVASPEEMLAELTPGWRWEIVPVVDEVQHGRQMVRDIFGQCWFDEVFCKAGLEHLAMYSKEWNARLANWTDQHRKDVHTEAADAFRQFAQGWSEPAVRAGQRPKRRRGMAA
ncbi:hypothetical protein V5F77_04320 [Xanthobacter sp. DSM 24535]|uniref:hypothetical protein n=1 Tax=Roseixanthobacter psychrophilus TaxID=3119917 RepID=UPI00372CE6DC